jgi:hypothetical protein
MTDDAQIPNVSSDAKEKRPYPEPLIGCAVGGCLIPLLLFIFCLLVLKDIGGYLFWPFIAIPLALIGAGIGYGINLYKNRKKQK